MNKILITLAGPTGIGKTTLAITLAKHLNTEVISADSRQFYAEMGIGTAVPAVEELREVKHHFIQHRTIHEPYSVGAFRDEALGLLSELFKTYDTVIMVGGSGLYLDAVTKGLDEFPEIKPGVRERLNERYTKEGIEHLQKLLKELDPTYYQNVDVQNPHRLIRALEVCLSSGKPFSSYLGNRKAPDFFTHLPLGLTAPREVIYQRIEARVDQMIEEGLLDEVKALYPHRHLNALQTVGYQELFNFLEGRYNLDTAINQIKQNTRRFAKRQGTWFRRDAEIIWFDRETPILEITEAVDAKLKRLQYDG